MSPATALGGISQERFTGVSWTIIPHKPYCGKWLDTHTMSLMWFCIRTKLFFRQKSVWRFDLMWWPAYTGVIVRPSQSEAVIYLDISRTFWPRTTTFYRTSILVGSTTTLDMTSLAALGWQLSKFKKRSKMPPLTALGGIFQELFKLNFTGISWTIIPTNEPDVTSVAVSGWQQKAIKYCTEVH